MSNVIEKFDQILAITNEINREDSSAAIIVSVYSQGKLAGTVCGKGEDLAVAIAYTINETDGLLDIVKVAVDAFENVPLK